MHSVRSRKACEVAYCGFICEMERKTIIATAAASIIVASAAAAERKRRRRCTWVKSWVQKRDTGVGLLHMVDNELRLEDPHCYRQFMRMTEQNFDELLSLIVLDIKKEDTCMRAAISPRERLAVTLRFLASGETFRSLMFSTRIHESTISKIVPEVCRAIYTRLRPLYVKCPQTQAQWLSVSQKFEELWDYPMCIGAIDGKHIVFRAPRSAGSYYFNYKGAHSIVLLAVVDAECKFLYVDVGVNGRVSDGGVWRHTSLYKNMERLHIPPCGSLCTGMNVPYHFVADDAFALSQRLMKPFPARNLSADKINFNYRLSRVRRVAENAFGILANRFRILSPINLDVQKIDDLVLATVALHNFLACKNKSNYTDTSGDQLLSIDSLAVDPGQRSTVGAQRMRDELAQYFKQN